MLGVFCSPPSQRGTNDSSPQESKAPAAAAVIPPPTWYDPHSTRHDLGLILSGTEVSRSHSFRVTNISGQAVQILGVVNRKPCCGDVAFVPPTVVEPGQAITVPVTIKLGLGSGQVVHVATVEVAGTDDGVNLSTTAQAQARATVDETQLTDGAVEIGRSRRVEYLIHSFGTADDPPRPLDDQAIRCELPTEWVGPAAMDVGQPDRLIEVHRLLAVTLPAAVEPGQRRAELEVRGLDGAVIGRRQIHWEVASMLVVSPSGLIFGPERSVDSEREIIVRCRDQQPFRIIGTTTTLAGLAIDADHDSKRLHTVHVRWSRPDRSQSQTGEVIFQTDHPSQSVVKVAIYMAATPGERVEAFSPRSEP